MMSMNEYGGGRFVLVFGFSFTHAGLLPVFILLDLSG